MNLNSLNPNKEYKIRLSDVKMPGEEDMIITLLIPTRKRPDIMQRIWNSANETASSPISLQISFFIDADDRESIAKLSLMMSRERDKYPDSKRITGVVHKRLLIGSDMWNHAYRGSEVTGDIVFYGCDNAVFKTKGWDETIREEFRKVPDRILYVHGKDGVRKDDLGTMGFIHRNWINAVGFVTPPYFIFYKADRWLTDTAKKIGRDVYREDILIEHTHYADKTANDETCHERNDMFKGGADYTLNKYDVYDNRITSRKDELPASVLLTRFIQDYYR